MGNPMQVTWDVGEVGLEGVVGLVGPWEGLFGPEGV